MLRLIATILFCLLLPLAAWSAPLANYTPVQRAMLTQEGERLLVLRKFDQDGVPRALVVNPWSLATRIVPQAELSPAPTPMPADTPYDRALADTTRGPVRLQNHGLSHARQQVAGQFLTVDLCPSQRPFEQAFFAALTTLPQSPPIPVAVAITGSWLSSHQKEFDWLRGEERAGRLAITWVNHSLTHPYVAGVPLAQTFMLTPGLDRRREILALEQRLIEQGVVPSVFFRFPGLVTDEAAISLLRELGLIPLGSDAWLAKGEIPRAGSIILVHGNGNEPAGMRRFAELRQQTLPIRLLPLNQAIVTAPREGATR